MISYFLMLFLAAAMIQIQIDINHLNIMKNKYILLFVNSNFCKIVLFSSMLHNTKSIRNN